MPPQSVLDAYNNAISNTNAASQVRNRVASKTPFDFQAYALASTAYDAASNAEDKALTVLQGSLLDNDDVDGLLQQLTQENIQMQQAATRLSTAASDLRAFADAANAVTGILVQLIPFLGA